MKKNVFALLVAALVFVACGTKKEEAPASEETVVESTTGEGNVGVEVEGEVSTELQEDSTQN